MKQADSQKHYSFPYGCYAIIIAIAITTYRIYFLYLNKYPLYADEAQYFSWASSFEFGYYSKPPMIAWVIMLTTKLFGTIEWAVRLASPILHLFTSLIIYKIADRLYGVAKANKVLDRRATGKGFYACITYLSLPSVTLSSSLITTDPLLLFFWAATIYLFIKALDNNQLLYWVLAGITAGFGILSKYNMIFFLPSALLYIFFTRKFEVIKSRGFFITIVIASMVYLPNLVWNINNDFVSYLHTKEISQINKDLLHPIKMLEFLGSQIAIFGPILSWIFITSIFRLKSLLKKDNYKLLICFYAPFLIIITSLSLISNAYGNWAAPIYITLTIWVVAYALENNQKWLVIASCILHLLIGCAFYNYDKLEQFIASNFSYELPDPFQRLKGWRELGDEVKLVMHNYPGIELLCDDRKLTAELLYYVSANVKKWNSHVIHDHYDMTRTINHELGKDFILITKQANINNYQPYFHNSYLIKKIYIKLNKNHIIEYNSYYLNGFKGYNPMINPKKF